MNQDVRLVLQDVGDASGPASLTIRVIDGIEWIAELDLTIVRPILRDRLSVELEYRANDARNGHARTVSSDERLHANGLARLRDAIRVNPWLDIALHEMRDDLSALRIGDGE